MYYCCLPAPSETMPCPYCKVPAGIACLPTCANPNYLPAAPCFMCGEQHLPQWLTAPCVHCGEPLRMVACNAALPCCNTCSLAASEFAPCPTCGEPLLVGEPCGECNGFAPCPCCCEPLPAGSLAACPNCGIPASEYAPCPYCGAAAGEPCKPTCEPPGP